MGRKMKKLTRVGAGALAGVMVFGLAAPLAPLSVEAADEVKNLAIGSTATASEVEAGTQFNAEKAVDGTVDRNTKKSRWATNTHGNQEAQWLKIDLKEEILRVIRSRYLKQVKITHGKMFIQRQGKVIFLM